MGIIQTGLAFEILGKSYLSLFATCKAYYFRSSIYSLVYSFFVSVRQKFRRWTQVAIDFGDAREGAPSPSATCREVLLSSPYIFSCIFFL